MGDGGTLSTAWAADPDRTNRRTAVTKRRSTARPRPRPPGRRLEFDLGDGLAARRRTEEGLVPEAGERGHEAAREEPEARVVLADRFVEAAALHGDAVLRALELALERQEVLVALEIRVALHHDQQPAEGSAQLALGLLELLQRLRIVEQSGRRLDPRHAGPGPRDFVEHGG